MEHLAHTVCQNACARMVLSAQRSTVHVHVNVAGLEFPVAVNAPMATLGKTVQNGVNVLYMQFAINLMVLVAAQESTKGHTVTKVSTSHVNPAENSFYAIDQTVPCAITRRCSFSSF